MNRDQLMDALSGIDPKYIEEAAYELHALPARKEGRRTLSAKRVVFLALPIAAAAFLTILVAFPAIIRMSNTHDAATSQSDSASYESAQEAAEPMGEAAAETEAPEAPLTEDKEAVDSCAEEAPVLNEAITGSAASTEGLFSLTAASYDDGILTVSFLGTLPTPVEETAYLIRGTDDSGAVVTCGEGTLGSLMTGADPLTLDLKELSLQPGVYTLTIAGQDIEFGVKGDGSF
ncbi:MAG: hypothetical protein II800_09005 [Lachnospiraceae bacterium]|nr:hypothetical protein [Lachnospiraceae bacterium]